jgi:hypothetical protein
MQDTVNLLMLLCASVAALAFGVLSAQVLCRAAFGILKMHARSVAAESAIDKGAVEAKAATA